MKDNDMALETNNDDNFSFLNSDLQVFNIFKFLVFAKDTVAFVPFSNFRMK